VSPVVWKAAAAALGGALLLTACEQGPLVGHDVDVEAFCESAREVEAAVQHEAVHRSEDFVGEYVEAAFRDVHSALARLRDSALPSLRDDIDTYAMGFDPPQARGLRGPAYHAGQRIADVVESDCGFTFVFLPRGKAGADA
jgi:hypothetical protein